MDKSDIKFVEIIGTGTFGTVYKCVDANNNLRCIKRIKLVSTSDIATNAHFEMIQQEIYLLQNLVHPRIITLFGYFFSEEDHKYVDIVMEYASLGSLTKMIATQNARHRFFDKNRIKYFLIDMVLGIEYLHMKSVVHKDLKPCNILVFGNGRLKITDFGVSKITDLYSCNLMTKRSQVKEADGSPIYCAPETLIHNHSSFSSDVWALGCILYELCTLKPAFGFVESMDELIRCTLTKAYAPLNPDIHPCCMQMVDLCEKMLYADVGKRVTLKDIINSPLIVVDYYRSYFQLDA